MRGKNDCRRLEEHRAAAVELEAEERRAATARDVAVLEERCAAAAEPIVVSTPGEFVAELSIQDDVAAMISGTDTTAPPPCARATFHF